ncbi:MaoC/PaaZ C-terminal domain-containing protein [Streptomyces sp. URMC 123]|uniref:MaoC/PaaZ C-terminal domain-containing protein n=1 Tax=Streptomyces sp. URMC 123 TaxID=3423403 RepID=UPI003F1BA187
MPVRLDFPPTGDRAPGPAEGDAPGVPDAPAPGAPGTPCASAEPPLPVFRPAGADRLPPLTVPVTRTLIVAGAIASRDYQDVHHDVTAARAQGAPDIFMNILTTQGLVGRYVTDHFGPRARLRRAAIRLGVPNYPGDTMVLTGTVVTDTADQGTGRRRIEVRVTGDNALGRHVTGTVALDVPEESA